MLIGIRDTGYRPSISQGRCAAVFRPDPEPDMHVVFVICLLMRNYLSVVNADIQRFVLCISLSDSLSSPTNFCRVARRSPNKQRAQSKATRGPSGHPHAVRALHL